MNVEFYDIIKVLREIKEELAKINENLSKKGRRN